MFLALQIPALGMLSIIVKEALETKSCKDACSAHNFMLGNMNIMLNNY